ncbi:endonuclease/exonuclease/phosphatase family protein [Blastopirellula sp. JC732]|uniref:Endonuclease/exonuclease/phosphatase family protein n=1 Tax=Blastopirellula sediminis TaxID=2894196 RepID=A0A9X1MP54_9BACT|nr:endonuclease/exonuclease/phosphatase family protein [Blastopirellula sediminis]MCC9606852.1 endonuclease/exonuclease/phosphatase family protein [Blastopirellula sediminis]MCC9629852.1 endonuclease/exonuclease/phosphatase family protein [Blastopirellula sediminis]
MRALILSVLAFLFGLIFSGGCNVEQLEKLAAEVAQQQQNQQTESTATTPISTGGPTAAPSGDTIRIASFNIQVFGQSKIGKPDVMQVLTEIVRKFDVVAIQELRSKEQDVIPRFLQMINANGRNYDSIVGPPLGRTSSKEQYVFIYDKNRIAVEPSSVYTINDPSDLLHREPMVATFRAIGADQTRAPFRFSLINIHTDPDETDQELDALGEVYQLVRYSGHEDDVILLGDLNVDYKHLGALGQVPGITYTVSDEPTNTLRKKSYDNLVFIAADTREFTGRAGVYDMQKEHGLTLEQASEVSDHLPVWGEFSAYEAGPSAVASGAGAPVR